MSHNRHICVLILFLTLSALIGIDTTTPHTAWASDMAKHPDQSITGVQGGAPAHWVFLLNPKDFAQSLSAIKSNRFKPHIVTTDLYTTPPFFKEGIKELGSTHIAYVAGGNIERRTTGANPTWWSNPKSRPDWVLQADPKWPGELRLDLSYPEARNIIRNQARMAWESGSSGINVDNLNHKAIKTEDVITLINELRADAIAAGKPDFKIYAQNADEHVGAAPDAFKGKLTGVVVEDMFYSGDGGGGKDGDTPTTEFADRKKNLTIISQNGFELLNSEYAQKHAADAYQKSINAGVFTATSVGNEPQTQYQPVPNGVQLAQAAPTRAVAAAAAPIIPGTTPFNDFMRTAQARTIRGVPDTPPVADTGATRSAAVAPPPPPAVVQPSKLTFPLTGTQWSAEDVTRLRSHLQARAKTEHLIPGAQLHEYIHHHSNDTGVSKELYDDYRGYKKHFQSMPRTDVVNLLSQLEPKERADIVNVAKKHLDGLAENYPIYLQGRKDAIAAGEQPADSLGEFNASWKKSEDQQRDIIRLVQEADTLAAKGKTISPVPPPPAEGGTATKGLAGAPQPPAPPPPVTTKISPLTPQQKIGVREGVIALLNETKPIAPLGSTLKDLSPEILEIMRETATSYVESDPDKKNDVTKRAAELTELVAAEQKRRGIAPAPAAAKVDPTLAAQKASVKLGKTLDDTLSGAIKSKAGTQFTPDQIASYLLRQNPALLPEALRGMDGKQLEVLRDATKKVAEDIPKTYEADVQAEAAKRAEAVAKAIADEQRIQAELKTDKERADRLAQRKAEQDALAKETSAAEPPRPQPQTGPAREGKADVGTETPPPAAAPPPQPKPKAGGDKPKSPAHKKEPAGDSPPRRGKQTQRDHDSGGDDHRGEARRAARGARDHGVRHDHDDDRRKGPSGMPKWAERAFGMDGGGR